MPVLALPPVARYVMPGLGAGGSSREGDSGSRRLTVLPQPPATAATAISTSSDSNSSTTTTTNHRRHGRLPHSSSSLSASSSSSLPSSKPVVQQLRSDIYTSWRIKLPDGRVEIHIRASQARASYGHSNNSIGNRSTSSNNSSNGHNGYVREQGGILANERKTSRQLSVPLPLSSSSPPSSTLGHKEQPQHVPPPPTMVHETRHHDYDHDVDLDYVPTDSEEEGEEEEEEKSPEELLTSALAASKRTSSPKNTVATATGAAAHSSSSPSSPARRRRPSAKAPAVAVRKRVPGDRVPGLLRFPVLLLSNYLLSMVFYSLFMPFTAYDLSTVSRSAGSWGEIAALAAFKAVELAVGWWGQYDGYDLASLTLLSHTPYLFLLTSFYSIRLSTLVVSLLIDVTSVLVPTQLLRPLSWAHYPDAPARQIANRSIVSDVPVQVYTSLFGSAVYALVVSVAFQLGLPAVLVGRFESLTSLTFAHSPYLLPQLVLGFLPLGLAAKVFIFTPATSVRRDRKDAQVDRFNPETAGLGETLLYNVWGFRHRSRVAIARTALLAAVTGVNTFVQVVAHVAGTEPWGAAIWSAVWSAASIATGYVLWWVANVHEVRAV